MMNMPNQHEDRHTQYARTLMAQALGEAMLEHMNTTDKKAKELTAVLSLKLLFQIMDTLDDVSLDDFYCIDRIVDILAEHGLYTHRHDW